VLLKLIFADKHNFLLIMFVLLKKKGGRCGRDRMVVWFTTTYAIQIKQSLAGYIPFAIL